MSSNDSTAKEQSFLFNVNKIFLVIHLLMLFMFSSLGVDLMAGVSLISICFYFLAFSLTKSEKLSIYVYSVAVEILLYMILAVVCLGIQCNFQLFLIDAMFFLFSMNYGMLLIIIVMEGAYAIYTFTRPYRVFTSGRFK